MMELIQKEQTCTLSYFPDEYREQMLMLGCKSGRDSDKMKEVELTAIQKPSDNIAFEEARLIIECKEMGYPATLIYGEPEYYKRFGFKLSKEYKITNQDKKYPAAMQVWELYFGALKGIEGIYDEGGIYAVDPQEVEKFDKGFPVKEKKHTKTQDRFLELVDKFI